MIAKHGTDLRTKQDRRDESDRRKAKELSVA